MPPTAKSVVIALSDFANNNGDCWPSLAKICQRTCFGKTAVINAIKWLERSQILVVNRADRYHTNYRLKPAAFAMPESAVLGNSRYRKRDLSVIACQQSGCCHDPQQVHQTDHQDVETDHKARQADTNRYRSLSTVNSYRGHPPVTQLMCPNGVCEQTWQDWLALRHAKRAPVTATVLNQARSEATKACLSLEEFLAIWCARGSQGLQADWLQSMPRRRPAQLAQAMATPTGKSKVLSAIETLQGMKDANVDSQ